jgi:hypothetical protein
MLPSYLFNPIAQSSVTESASRKALNKVVGSLFVGCIIAVEYLLTEIDCRERFGTWWCIGANVVLSAFAMGLLFKFLHHWGPEDWRKEPGERTVSLWRLTMAMVVVVVIAIVSAFIAVIIKLYLSDHGF